MGQRIVQHEVKGKTLYLVWSSIVDAPVSYGMTKPQLATWWSEEYGRSGESILARMLDRAATVDDMIPCNRAGAGETKLTSEQIVDWYFVRKGNGKAPHGTEDKGE